ncbi:hypothetical protein AGDE_11825 [Angomonas deanei]|nr:hypothetical protein AGDE_11825 [Angomonas deanei]|eukprot:EPY25382.1 hypothetical protein AGDE_11825 [Angomonas deanei]
MDRSENFVSDRAVVQRQSDFLRYFSRQLEPNLNPAVENTVLFSCRCALLSLGHPQLGVLYVTRQGLFFASEAYMQQQDRHNIRTAAALNSSHPSSSDDEDATETASNASELHEWVMEGKEVIKDYVNIAHVASLLPSVLLKSRAPYSDIYVMGIPNPAVLPTAVQVFTVKPAQLFQFTNPYDVVIKPPDLSNIAYSSSYSSGYTDSKTNRYSPPPAEGTTMKLIELLSFNEYDLIKLFPSGTDAMVVTALLDRLLRSFKVEHNYPLLHPKAEYAAPH